MVNSISSKSNTLFSFSSIFIGYVLSLKSSVLIFIFACALFFIIHYYLTADVKNNCSSKKATPKSKK